MIACLPQQKESTDEEYTNLCEEMLVLQAQMLSLNDKNKKLAAKVEDLKASKNAANIELSQTQLDHSNLLEEFVQFKSEAKDWEDSAFEQGMEKAENDLDLQIPTLEKEYFTKGWLAALTATCVPPVFQALYSSFLCMFIRATAVLKTTILKKQPF